MSRNILITPNRGLTGVTEQPSIAFSGLTAGTINLVVEDDGSIVYEGLTGSLFGIEDNKDGLLHSVNDVSGLSIFQVWSENMLKMGKWDANTLIVSGNSWNVLIGDNHSISDETSLRSSIIGGDGNTVSPSVLNSVIVGGSGITASVSNTIYTPNLNVSGEILIENGATVDTVLTGGSPRVKIEGSGDTLTRFNASVGGGIATELGSRGLSEPSFPGYGKQGDSFLNSNIASNGLNLISSPGTGTEDYIRFYAGNDASAVASMHIGGTGATKGNVGIGTENPSSKLHVVGQSLFTDIIETNGQASVTSSVSTTTITLVATNEMIFVAPSIVTGAVTITMPTTSSLKDGQMFTFRRTNSTAPSCTLTPNGASWSHIGGTTSNPTIGSHASRKWVYRVSNTTWYEIT